MTLGGVLDKKILMIAGPNGAGKTTFAREYLLREAVCPTFINADLIAAGLAPFAPERAAFRAGRLMLEEIHDHVRRGESFAIETTLSGKGYAALIPAWQAAGFAVKLIYLKLATPDLAVARVQRRVGEGGHNIPEPTIRRRFAAGLLNFENIYKALVNAWALYDNSEENLVFIESGGEGMSEADANVVREPAAVSSELAGIEAALKRAAEVARQRAKQLGHGVMIWKDGRVVEDRRALDEPSQDSGPRGMD